MSNRTVGLSATSRQVASRPRRGGVYASVGQNQAGPELGGGATRSVPKTGPNGLLGPVLCPVHALRGSIAIRRANPAPIDRKSARSLHSLVPDMGLADLHSRREPATITAREQTLRERQCSVGPADPGPRRLIALDVDDFDLEADHPGGQAILTGFVGQCSQVRSTAREHASTNGKGTSSRSVSGTSLRSPPPWYQPGRASYMGEGGAEGDLKSAICAAKPAR